MYTYVYICINCINIYIYILLGLPHESNIEGRATIKIARTALHLHLYMRVPALLHVARSILDG